MILERIYGPKVAADLERFGFDENWLRGALSPVRGEGAAATLERLKNLVETSQAWKALQRDRDEEMLHL